MNEYALLGVGKPFYGAAGNMTKLVCLVVGIPLALKTTGLLGTILVVAFSDFCRYIPVLIGQRRERLSFFLQDVAVTLFLLVLLGAFILLRWQAGFGTPFDGATFS
jgi:hypothetical protein